jgi:hypothetical protein
MLKRIAAGLLAGAALSTTALPASADVNTGSVIRWNSGAAVWTTTLDNVSSFLKSKNAEAPDRGLTSGLAASGWTAKEVQAGLSKEYNVDLVGVSRFLYSKDGVKFLQDQTRSYSSTSASPAGSSPPAPKWRASAAMARLSVDSGSGWPATS